MKKIKFKKIYIPFACCCLFGSALAIAINTIFKNSVSETVKFLENNDYVNISLNSISKIEKLLTNSNLKSNNAVSQVKYSSNNKTDNGESNLVYEIANAVELQNSFVVGKLIEINKINEIKKEFVSYVIDLYTNGADCTSYTEVQNQSFVTQLNNGSDLEVEKQCGSFFSGHFWDACSKQLWTSAVGALAYAYVPVVGLMQFFVIIAQISQNNWSGVAGAMAEFDISTPKWLIDTVTNTAKTMKSWKATTRCSWTYFVTEYYKI